MLSSFSSPFKKEFELKKQKHFLFPVTSSIFCGGCLQKKLFPLQEINKSVKNKAKNS